MIYYKLPDGSVYAYDTAAERDSFGPDALVLMSDDEVEAHLHPRPSAESERAKRDALLVDLDAVVSNPLRWLSFDDAQKTTLATYRQALLDVPQQPGFPEHIDWPEKPEFL